MHEEIHHLYIKTKMVVLSFQAIGECVISEAASLYLIIITSSSSLLCAAPVGLLLRHAGRVKCVVLAALLDVSLLAVVLYVRHWTITEYIVVCVMRGIADAVYHTAFTGKSVSGYSYRY